MSFHFVLNEPRKQLSVRHLHDVVVWDHSPPTVTESFLSFNLQLFSQKFNLKTVEFNLNAYNSITSVFFSHLQDNSNISPWSFIYSVSIKFSFHLLFFIFLSWRYVEFVYFIPSPAAKQILYTFCAWTTKWCDSENGVVLKFSQFAFVARWSFWGTILETPTGSWSQVESWWLPITPLRGRVLVVRVGVG